MPKKKNPAPTTTHTEARSENLQVRITPSDKEALQQLAIDQSSPGDVYSMASLVYGLIEDFLRKKGKK